MFARISVVIAVSVLAFGFGSAAAQAALVTFDFTGTVTDCTYTTFPLEPGEISGGHSFFGSYTFESSQDPDGLYDLDNFTITFGSNTFSFDPDIVAQILVINGESDVYLLDGGLTFGNVDLGFELEMVDTDGLVFENNHLPVVPPDLSFFEGKELTISCSGEAYFDLAGSIESLTVIPSPTSALLGLIGLAAVFSLRRQFG